MMSQKTRVAVIGLGERGKQLLEVLLRMEDVQIAALCDVYCDRIEHAVHMVEEAGGIPMEIPDFTQGAYRNRKESSCGKYALDQ